MKSPAESPCDADARSAVDSLTPAVPLDRRGFIVTALGAGFALAVQPTAADLANKKTFLEDNGQFPRKLTIA